MQVVKYAAIFNLCGTLVLSSIACNARAETAPIRNSEQRRDTISMPTVSAEQIREVIRSADEDVSETTLGTLLIKRSDDSGKKPGKIFLNGELIYTARQQEALPHLRGMPFRLHLVSFQSNDKKQPNFRVTRMVIQERSWTCQYFVLDFTGQNVWISERFPKEAFQKGECVEMTWVRWEKNLAYFYFGADDQDWEKGVYRGWVEGYNAKLKAVFGPVDAPSPPKRASLVPKLKPL